MAGKFEPTTTGEARNRSGTFAELRSRRLGALVELPSRHDAPNACLLCRVEQTP